MRSEIMRNGKIKIDFDDSENLTDTENIDRLGKPKASFQDLLTYVEETKVRLHHVQWSLSYPKAFFP